MKRHTHFEWKASCLFISLTFLLLFRNWTEDQNQNLGKDDPYWEGIEAKFQQDTLRGFGGRRIHMLKMGIMAMLRVVYMILYLFARWRHQFMPVA